jgi:hypothetical protein
MRKLEMGTVLIRAYLTNKQISQIRQIFSNLSIFGTQVFPDDKLCCGQIVNPIILARVSEQAKVSFYFLIGPLRLAIRLGVVSSCQRVGDT